ncbi:MAG: hypothetical protein HY332_17020 [Chloroflexi bacterium]|nr:hypothetical protein [Chloroflexota bacterium]
MARAVFATHVLPALLSPDDIGFWYRWPEHVPGQVGIYDSKPGDANCSLIWRYNYVLVPRDYEANTLRSEEDCLQSGYEIVRGDTYTN